MEPEQNQSYPLKARRFDIGFQKNHPLQGGLGPHGADGRNGDIEKDNGGCSDQGPSGEVKICQKERDYGKSLYMDSFGSVKLQAPRDRHGNWRSEVTELQYGKPGDVVK